jgi:hypothetical protein
MSWSHGGKPLVLWVTSMVGPARGAACLDYIVANRVLCEFYEHHQIQIIYFQNIIC